MKNNNKKILFFMAFMLINIIFISCVSAEDTAENIYLQSCGNGLVQNIPIHLPRVISLIYTLIQVAVPVLLVIYGMLDLMKGVIAQKEEDIKKGQQAFIKRLVIAILIFFVFSIVKIVISFVSSDTANITDCVECFISNKCDNMQLEDDLSDPRYRTY